MINIPLLSFSTIFIFSSLGVWLAAISAHRLQHQTWKLLRFPFSIRNYYLFLSPLILSVLIISLFREGLNYLLLFLIFGFAGVLAETFCSFWWRILFPGRFYIYHEEVAFNGYTSWLNFVPWGIGGLLYVTIARITSPTLLENNLYPVLTEGMVFLTVALIVVGTISVVFKLKNIPSFSWRYLISSLPFLLLFIYCSIAGSTIYLVLTIAFGLAAWFIEYLYGKLAQFFVSRKLWTYNYLALDHGHITPLSIPGFALLGYYFLFIYAVLGRFLP